MMKKIILFILFSIVSFAQVPQGMSHRGTAYNTSGVILQNTNISVRVRILDGSASGTVVYEENHSKMTNGSGQYNFNIGQGTPQGTYTFSGINWSVTTKFLEIAIDPNNGTNYTVIGSSQLMSVPYALYSLNSQNSQIKVYNNVNELSVAAASGSLNEIAYIKGHTTPGDGGEGNFIWRGDLPINNLPDNNGTIIRLDRSASPQNPKGWIRIIEDKINVKYFGIKFDNTDGDVIQKAIDFAANNVFNNIILASPDIYFRDYTKCGSKVFIPAGTYNINNPLVIKYGVSIEGDNILTTHLKATNQTSDKSMFELDAGQVSNISISNLTLDGNTNVSSSITKDCMKLIAHSGPNHIGYSFTTGGLWGANFKRILIKNFNGSGIILEGSGINDENRNWVNQFCVFEDISITRQKDTSCCLLIKGNLGQFTFINCGFDGYPPVTTNPTYSTNKFFNVAIETNGAEASVIKFITCTFQYSEYGVYTSYAQNVTFDNCWFEYLDTAIAASKSPINTNTSKCINVLNSRFANASGFGSEYLKVTNSNFNQGVNGVYDNGSCISVEGGSIVNAFNNFVITSNAVVNPGSKFIKNYGLDSVINSANNTFQFPVLGKTYGIGNKIITPTSSTLDCLSYKFLTINTYNNNIKELKSNITPGETITIKAVGGSLKFDGSLNIVFSKSSITPTSPFILLTNEVATFMKIDNPKIVNGTIYDYTWVLTSVNKTY